MKKTTLAILFCVATFGTGQAANALTISLGVGAGGVAGDHILGEVFQPGDLGGGLLVRDTAAVNGLRGVALGARTGTNPEYYRSTSDFGSLPTATADGAVFAAGVANMTVVGSGPSARINLVLSSAFTYLVATWDGPHGGAEVYYIGGIAAGNTLSVHRYARPSDDGSPNWGHLYNNPTNTQYGITTWTLFNPVAPVPDGGTTLALLGLGLAGLGLLKRRLGA